MLNRAAVLMLGVVGVAGSALGQSEGGPPPAMVTVDAVRMENIQQRREVTGEIRPVRRASIASEQDGLVIELSVEVGDWVDAGDPLAKLDERLMSLDLDRLIAERDSAEANTAERTAMIEKAQRDLERLQQLLTREGASKNEVDDATTFLRQHEARLLQARADAASAEASRRSAEKKLSDMTIRAPFAGTVVAKLVELGEWVSDGAAVVELVSVEEVDAYLDVPERFVGALSAPGALVQLRVPAIGQTIEAPVTSVVAIGDRLARTFPVRLRLDNRAESAAKGLLRPGMSVIGMVPTGEPADVLTIHKDAVMRNDAGSYVYFDSGGRAAVAPVEMQFAVGDRVVVRSPMLKPGTSVVTQGNERIFPGQPLTIMAPPGGPDASKPSVPAGQGS